MVVFLSFYCILNLQAKEQNNSLLLTFLMKGYDQNFCNYFLKGAKQIQEILDFKVRVKNCEVLWIEKVSK